MAFRNSGRNAEIVPISKDSFAVNVGKFNSPGPGTYGIIARRRPPQKFASARRRRKRRSSSVNRAENMADLLSSLGQKTSFYGTQRKRNRSRSKVVSGTRSKSIPRRKRKTRITKKLRRNTLQREETNKNHKTISKLEEMIEKMLSFEQKMDKKLQSFSGQLTSRIDGLQQGLQGNNVQIMELEKAFSSMSNTPSVPSELLAQSESSKSKSPEIQSCSGTSDPPHVMMNGRNLHSQFERPPESPIQQIEQYWDEMKENEEHNGDHEHHFGSEPEEQKECGNYSYDKDAQRMVAQLLAERQQSFKQQSVNALNAQSHIGSREVIQQQLQQAQDDRQWQVRVTQISIFCVLMGIFIGRMSAWILTIDHGS